MKWAQWLFRCWDSYSSSGRGSWNWTDFSAPLFWWSDFSSSLWASWVPLCSREWCHLLVEQCPQLSLWCLGLLGDLLHWSNWHPRLGLHPLLALHPWLELAWSHSILSGDLAEDLMDRPTAAGPLLHAWMHVFSLSFTSSYKLLNLLAMSQHCLWWDSHGRLRLPGSWQVGDCSH